MTIGELARMFNDAFGIGAALHVVPMRGWTRATIWPQTNLPWIRTSPNMPTWQTTFVYLCTGLVANAGVNNGVGTSAPFFYAGTFGLDGDAYAASLAKRPQAGVAFPSRAGRRARAFGKTARSTGASRRHESERVLAGARIGRVARCVARNRPARDAHRTRDARSRLGNGLASPGLQQGLDADTIVGAWQGDLARFKARRERFCSMSDALTQRLIDAIAPIRSRPVRRTSPFTRSMPTRRAAAQRGRTSNVRAGRQRDRQDRRELGEPIVPRGAGTGLCGGAVPWTRRRHLVPRMNRILELDLPRRRARVQPGLVNLDLSTKIAASACSTPDPARSAWPRSRQRRDQRGRPHCLAYGTTVNHVLGLEIVDESGEVFTTASTTRDTILTGALVGSEGTLAS